MFILSRHYVHPGGLSTILVEIVTDKGDFVCIVCLAVFILVFSCFAIVFGFERRPEKVITMSLLSRFALRNADGGKLIVLLFIWLVRINFFCFVVVFSKVWKCLPSALPKSIVVRPRLLASPGRVLSSNAAAAAAGSHNHPKIWILEKAVSAALLGVIPAAFLIPSPILDYALALSLVAHVHWGLEAVVVDYVRPRLFGPVVPKLALASLYLVSVAALAGLFYLTYSDVGVATAIKMFARSS